MRPHCRGKVSRRFEHVVLLGLLLVLPSGCRAKTDAATQQTVADASGPVAAIVPLLRHSDDETVVTTVSGRESFTCTAGQQTERPTERPCRRFSILARRPGSLIVRLTWDNGHPLLVAVTTADGTPIHASCCRSPQLVTVAVVPGSAYELQIMLVTAWGHDERQPFELTTSWEF
jgi:hypothetical protein